MFRTFKRQLRRAAFTALLSLTSPLALAGEPYVPITDFPASPCSFELADTEELCGWGTHDSGPLERLALLEKVVPRQAGNENELAEQDAGEQVVGGNSVAKSAEAAASAVLGTIKVRVQQVVEPFVMVGPNLTDSVAKVDAFLNWWKDLESTAIQDAAPEPLSEEDEATPIVSSEPVSIDDQIKQLAQVEPIDVGRYGRSILQRFEVVELPARPKAEPAVVEVAAETEKRLELEAIAEDWASVEPDVTDQPAVEALAIAKAEPAIEVTKLDPLVGGGPMVFTIRESYLPYDLSANDLKVWSVFPTTSKPFCVRQHEDEMDSLSIWKLEEAGEVVSLNAAEDKVVNLYGDEVAACHWDELLTNVVDWMTENELRDLAGAGKSDWADVGQSVAELAGATQNLADQLAVSLATLAGEEPVAKPMVIEKPVVNPVADEAEEQIAEIETIERVAKAESIEAAADDANEIR